MRFGVFNHAVDVCIRETARGLDADLLLLAGGLVFRRDLHDPVRIDVECYFDLRHAARRRRDADEVELTKKLVVRRHLALALEHADRDSRLIIFSSREYLALFRRDRRVAVDQPREDTTQRLDTER